jgi:hypothetical protein
MHDERKCQMLAVKIDGGIDIIDDVAHAYGGHQETSLL